MKFIMQCDDVFCVCLRTEVRFCELVGGKRDSLRTRVCGERLTGDVEQDGLLLCGAVGHVQGVGVSSGDTNTVGMRGGIADVGYRR